MGQDLTPEQIANWRRVLQQYFGPYALIMPESQIIKAKEKMQEAINKLAAAQKEKP